MKNNEAKPSKPRANGIPTWKVVSIIAGDTLCDNIPSRGLADAIAVTCDNYQKGKGKKK
jgi:hypothetical protein